MCTHSRASIGLDRAYCPDCKKDFKPKTEVYKQLLVLEQPCTTSLACLVESPDYANERSPTPESQTNLELPNLSNSPSIPEKSLADTTPTSLNTTTLEPLTQNQEVLTALLPDSPAKTSLTLENEPESMEKGQDFSLKSSDSFAWYDQDSSSWRTSQGCLLEGWEPFSASFPKSGTMRNGQLFHAPRWVESTEESESSLLPTPKAQDGTHPGIQAHKKGQTLHLSAAVQKMPLATPTASDWKIPRIPTNGGRSLNYEVAMTGNKKLSPALVERMMGFPEGWTEITSSDTPTSPNGSNELQIQTSSPIEKNDSKPSETALSPTSPRSPGQESPALLEELTIDEEHDRQHLERKIESAFIKAESVFRDAVKALKEIRDRKLYRSSHATFEEYCKDRFGFKRARPYQLINAAVVLENLENPVLQMSTKTEICRHLLPTNENQTRKLVDLSPEEQVTVWGKAVKSGKIPSGEKIKDTLDAHIRERLNQPPIPTYSEGDVVEIRSGGSSTLREHDGMWGIVTEVLPSRYKVYISLRNTEVQCKGNELEKVDEKLTVEIRLVSDRIKRLKECSLDAAEYAVLQIIAKNTCFSEKQMALLQFLEAQYGIE